MSRLCGYPLVGGGACAQLVADLAQPDCGRHRATAAQRASTTDERGCLMRHTNAWTWRCLTHVGAQWETAVAMGAALPCRIPLGESQRVELARRCNDPQTVKILAADPSVAVRTWLSSNEHLPADVLPLLARDPDPAVRLEVAGRPDLSRDLTHSLAKDPTEQVRAQLAENENIDAEALRLLAQSASVPVLKRVAQNLQAPADALEALAKNQDLNVWHQAMNNPNMSETFLLRLSRDPDPGVRRRLLGRSELPASVWDTLIEDSNIDVLLPLAGRSGVPARVLNRLWREGAPPVAEAAKREMDRRREQVKTLERRRSMAYFASLHRRR